MQEDWTISKTEFWKSAIKHENGYKYIELLNSFLKRSRKNTWSIDVDKRKQLRQVLVKLLKFFEIFLIFSRTGEKDLGARRFWLVEITRHCHRERFDWLKNDNIFIVKLTLLCKFLNQTERTGTWIEMPV